MAAARPKSFAEGMAKSSALEKPALSASLAELSTRPEPAFSYSLDPLLPLKNRAMKERLIYQRMPKRRYAGQRPPDALARHIQAKGEREVSWFQDDAQPSLALIEGHLPIVGCHGYRWGPLGWRIDCTNAASQT